MSETTPVWKSKRFYVTLLTAIIPYLPYVGPWAAANPEAYSAVLAALFGAVGVATTKPLSLK
jgi:hypothetical protein